MESLADALTRCRTVRTLSLEWARSGAVGSAALGRLLSSAACTLTSLNVTGCCMGTVGIAALADGLQANSSLTQLRLCERDLKSAGVMPLAPVRQSCGSGNDESRGRTLDLGWARMGIDSLADALRGDVMLALG